MTPVETLHVITLLNALCPSAYVRESSQQLVHELFADVDATDALVAGIRLADQQREIAWQDIHTEACRIGKERLARSKGPDPDSNGVRHYRTDLPEVLTLMISLQVPCPWCGAARGEACSVSGDVLRTPAHSARLIAVGPTRTEQVSGRRLVRPAYRE